jgi:signal peptidase II
VSALCGRFGSNEVEMHEKCRYGHTVTAFFYGKRNARIGIGRTNMKKEKTTYLRFVVFAVSLVLVGLDQLFKFLAVEYLSPIESYPIWDGVLRLTYVENPGAAFGIFAGKTVLLTGVTGILILGLTVLLLWGKIKSTYLMWCAGLIIGGGIGNLIDRIAMQYVVDYIHVELFHFAVFNFADCCVVIGTILIIIYFLFIEGRKEDEQKKEISNEGKTDGAE